MKHLAHDFHLFKKHFQRFFLCLGRIAFSARIGIEGQGLFQRVADTDVIDDKSARFVHKDAVYPCDGLHEGMPFHQLVNVERMEAGDIKAGQPHIPHNDQLQGVLRVLHAVGKQAAVFLYSSGDRQESPDCPGLPGQIPFCRKRKKS